MKVTRFFSWLVLTFCLYNSIQAQLDIKPDFNLDDLICKEQARAMAQMQMANQRNLTADQTDIFYQEIHWDIDPAVYYIKGVITYHYKSRVNQLSQLVLDLANTHQINYIHRGNQTLNYVHSQD